MLVTSNYILPSLEFSDRPLLNVQENFLLSLTRLEIIFNKMVPLLYQNGQKLNYIRIMYVGTSEFAPWRW